MEHRAPNRRRLDSKAARLIAFASTGYVVALLWDIAEGGSVPPPFWLLALAVNVTSAAALFAAAFERSWRLIAGSFVLLLSSLLGAYIAVLYWALADFTF